MVTPPGLGEAHGAFSSTPSHAGRKKSLSKGGSRREWAAGGAKQPGPHPHQVLWTPLPTPGEIPATFLLWLHPCSRGTWAGQELVGWGWHGATPSPPSTGLPRCLVSGPWCPQAWPAAALLPLHSPGSGLLSDSPHIPHTLPLPLTGSNSLSNAAPRPAPPESREARPCLTEIQQASDVPAQTRRTPHFQH